jgi:hypothetical protein
MTQPRANDVTVVSQFDSRRWQEIICRQEAGQAEGHGRTRPVAFAVALDLETAVVLAHDFGHDGKAQSAAGYVATAAIKWLGVPGTSLPGRLKWVGQVPGIKSCPKYHASME